MRLRFERLADGLRESLWFYPALAVAGAIALGLGIAALDRGFDAEGTSFSFGGGPDAARIVLSTIAGSMITFTGLVFTITMVVLQQASGQFSPRVLRTFLRDRQSQASLAVFMATFTYALVVLREVRSGEAPFVPSLAVQFTFVLVLASLGMFVAYVHHIARSIRVESIIRRVAEETVAAVDRLYPEERDGAPALPVDLPAGDRVVVSRAGRAGVVAGLDLAALETAAEESDCTLLVVPAIGDFVAEGAPLVAATGDGAGRQPPPERLARLVRIENERTMHQDPAFGFRQLVDIALRALSPGVNDPTTAVHALDRLHDLLRRLATRPIPSGRMVDGEGRLRVVTNAATWPGYLGLAVDEIRIEGADQLQVQRRLRAMLDDLREVALPPRRPPVEEQLRLLDRSVEREHREPVDGSRARGADHQGVGTGESVPESRAR